MNRQERDAAEEVTDKIEEVLKAGCQNNPDIVRPMTVWEE